MIIHYKSLQLNQTLFYSTSATSAYIEQAYEKDNRQPTSNVHILARRHILSGLPTNVTIINTVLGITLTQTELDLLTAIKPMNYFLTENIKDARQGIRNILNKERCAGVYIFTNLRTGAQLVGSSTNIGDRLSSYFTPKNIKFGKRLIFSDFRNFILSDYKLEIYIIEGKSSKILRGKTLILEQFYIFTLKPTLNTLKVAGSTPPNSLSLETLVEHGKKLGKSQGKPLFVYSNNVLVFQTISRKALSELSGISLSIISINKKSKGLIYGVLLISATLLEDCTVNLLNENNFRVLVSDLREKSRIENRIKYISNLKITQEAYNATKRIKVVATNIITGQVLTANSLLDMSRLFTITTNSSISDKTIRKYLLNGKTYLNWKFTK